VLLLVFWLALAVLAAGLLLVTGYLLLLTLAAVLAPRRGRTWSTAQRRFAILIPAHDEEALIGRLLQSLQHLGYPSELFDVHVVADNCSDRTARTAREFAGVAVHERFDADLMAKGFALRWLLRRLDRLDLSSTYDAFVVLDADSVVAPNLLDCLNAHLAAGSQVIQVFYSVLNAGQSPVAGLRYAALAALHYLRPLGRAGLGLSCGLKGNGMCFAAPVLERFAWQWFSLAEDAEFHLALVSEGTRVDFAPETWVLADMPVTLAQARSQNERWERGRVLLLHSRVLRLVLDALRERSALRLDAALEHALPPLSVPFALGTACLAGALVTSHASLAALAAAGLLGQVAYLLSGLLLVRAPLRLYLALAYAPVYVLWKLWLYVGALTRPGGAAWVRTARVAR
jgi:cellulose synthase/poly-beta-1,6-N-acetylglucosamine synthase-like glycosyltransferase